VLKIRRRIEFRGQTRSCLPGNHQHDFKVRITTASGARTINALHDSCLPLTCSRGYALARLLGYIPVNMPVEKKFSDLQSFGRIVEMISFVDGLPEMSAEEIEETAHRMCELPANPERTMNMEEV